MQKVICINDDWKNNPVFTRYNGPLPKFGETYKVVQLLESPWNAGKFLYILDGFPDWLGFVVKNFAPVSDIDETEFVREYKTELV